MKEKATQKKDMPSQNQKSWLHKTRLVRWVVCLCVCLCLCLCLCLCQRTCYFVRMCVCRCLRGGMCVGCRDSLERKSAEFAVVRVCAQAMAMYTHHVVLSAHNPLRHEPCIRFQPLLLTWKAVKTGRECVRACTCVHAN